MNIAAGYTDDRMLADLGLDPVLAESLREFAQRCIDDTINGANDDAAAVAPHAINAADWSPWGFWPDI